LNFGIENDGTICRSNRLQKKEKGKKKETILRNKKGKKEELGFGIVSG